MTFLDYTILCSYLSYSQVTRLVGSSEIRDSTNEIGIHLIKIQTVVQISYNIKCV